MKCFIYEGWRYWTTQDKSLCLLSTDSLVSHIRPFSNKEHGI